jgi:hypothetical protein
LRNGWTYTFNCKCHCDCGCTRILSQLWIKWLRKHVDVDISSSFGMQNSRPKCVRIFPLHSVYNITTDV